MSELTKTIGTRLRILRGGNHTGDHTEESIASALGNAGLKYNRNQVGFWELNKEEPTAEVLVWYTAFFNTTLDFIFGLTDKQSGPSDTKVCQTYLGSVTTKRLDLLLSSLKGSELTSEESALIDKPDADEMLMYSQKLGVSLNYLYGLEELKAIPTRKEESALLLEHGCNAPTVRQAIASRLKFLRKDADMGLKQLLGEVRLGGSELTTSVYNAYEDCRNETTIRKLIPLAKLFSVSVDYIFGRIGDKIGQSAHREFPENFLMADIEKRVGERLKTLRHEANLRPDDMLRDVLGFAEISKVEDVRALERGGKQVKGYVLYLYADYFNVSLDYLLCLTDDKTIYGLEIKEPVSKRHYASRFKTLTSYDIGSPLAANLISLRAKAGLTHAQLVKELQKINSSITIAEIEYCEDKKEKQPRWGFLVACAVFFNRSTDYLVGLTQDSSAPERSYQADATPSIIASRCTRLRGKEATTAINRTVLAELGNTYPTSIRDLEDTGAISPAMAYLYSKHYNVSMDYILGLSTRRGEFSKPTPADAPIVTTVIQEAKSKPEVLRQIISYPLHEVLGDNLRGLRTSRGLTLPKLSRALNLTQELIKRCEDGVQSTPAYVAIDYALHFHTSLDYLVGLTDDSTEPARFAAKTDDVLTQVGRRASQLRLTAGLSQQAIVTKVLTELNYSTNSLLVDQIELGNQMTLDFAYLYAKHFKISMEYIFCLTDDPTPIPRLPIVKVEEPVEEKKPEPIIMRQPIHVRDSVALQPRDEMILLSKERLRGVRDRRKWSRQEMVDAIAKTVGGVTFTVEDLEDFESGKRLAIIPVILGYSLFSRLSLDYLLGLAPDTRQPKRNSSIEVRGLLVKVGARLKELRERNGASTVDMVIEAVYCNIPCITRAAIEVLEQGNIVTDLVYMYSRRFNVSMEYLFCLTEQPGTFQHPAASDAPSGKVLSLVERNGSKVETKEVAAPKAKIVGTRMKNLREHYKISIETCAESGERAGYITQYESGDLMAPASYVSWFADFFDISIDYLFGRIDDSTGAIFSGKPKFVRDREALEAEAKNFLTSLGSSNWSPELQEVLKEALA